MATKQAVTQSGCEYLQSYFFLGKKYLFHGSDKFQKHEWKFKSSRNAAKAGASYPQVSSELFLVISNFYETLLVKCFCGGTEVRLLARILPLTVL